MDTKEKIKRTRVRAYPLEFKERVLAQCDEPGASVAKVALGHGLNANMLHTWRRQAHPSLQRLASGAGEFVSLPLPNASAPAANALIRIELRRGVTSVTVAWPVEAAGACAGWLRELLK
jgi:transposase